MAQIAALETGRIPQDGMHPAKFGEKQIQTSCFTITKTTSTPEKVGKISGQVEASLMYQEKGENPHLNTMMERILDFQNT